MNLHEFQAKRLFRDVGIPVPRGEVVDSPSVIVEVARRLGGGKWVVKAQVHAGERAAAGGILISDDLNQIKQFAHVMLAERLVTAQNAPSGQPVNQLLIELPYSIACEYYLSFLVDPHCGRIIVLAALFPPGGSSSLPSDEALHRIEINPITGLQLFQCRQLAVKLGLAKRSWAEFVELLGRLYQLMLDKDLTLIEISPLAEDQHGRLMALDAKISFDKNALPRQPMLATLVDTSQDDFQECRAMSKGLGFISMEGEVSCIVNGSGLALATLDMVQLKGGTIGNIIDVDNGVHAETLASAFKFLWRGGHGRVILVNIVGGIVRCDVVAEGVIAGMKQYDVHSPVIVRMEGSRAAEARELFMNSGLQVSLVADLEQAVQSAVDVVKG